LSNALSFLRLFFRFSLVQKPVVGFVQTWITTWYILTSLSSV